jgi:uncharacterized spore protein YtfJ
MEPIMDLINGIMNRLCALAKENAVVAQPISVDNRYVVPLCEIGVGFGGGGGGGQSEESSSSSKKSPRHASGGGMGAGGGTSVRPLAVLVVDGDDVRLESLQ